jgi:eukaryotic-like serine/threonine-protein kinase
VSDRMNGDLDGRTIGGRYKVDSELGRGGMARVYHATDTLLGRAVAVKVLSAQYADDANFVTRFRREARAAARLNHPNLVQVYDTGSDDGVHYIVMEYVEAKTLADYLSGGGRIMPDRAIELTEAVSDALTVAHSQGVIHRDIKPANIMVTRDGQVKVTDFGIARVTTNETVQQTAAVLGTASYLSPEQAQGEPIDQRSDLYSLGCVLYEMLTGRPPFIADSPVAVASKHVLEQPIPASRLNPDVSPELDAVVMRALAKNPDNRYQSAGEMKEDLERARRGLPVMATPILAGGPQTTQVINRPQPEPTSVLTTTGTTTATTGADRTPGWIIALIVFLVLAVLGVLLWLFARNLLSSNDSAQVKVPNVIGFTQEGAIQQLNDQGLTPKVETKVTTKAPPGTVFQQDPVAGELVDNGSDVTITVARGPKQIDVPDVVGMTVDEARSTLQDAGLDLGNVQQQESTEKEGSILSQNPAAGSSIDKGTPVDVIVATPPTSPSPTNIAVTDFTCQSIDHAQKELQKDGFNVVVSTTPEVNEACPEQNKVASQNPSSGSFPQGTTVTLVPSASGSPGA